MRTFSQFIIVIFFCSEFKIIDGKMHNGHIYFEILGNDQYYI